jgi:hypothetical protein
VSQETSNHSFDELARGLADGSVTRGKALRLLGAALVGGALASLPGAALADDDCRRFGRRCRRDSQCCSRNCVRRGDDKVCGCPEGQRRCNDRCVNLDRNENHCGSCSNRCAEGQECMEGVCGGGEPVCVSTGGSCNADTECCSGNCTGLVCQECPRNSCSPCNCGPDGTLNQSTCTCECSPLFASLCASNSTPELQGCCPNGAGTRCVPPGTVCSPF